MKVLMAPVFEENQYQDLLARSLRDRDLEVVADSFNLPPATFAWRILREDPDVLHLHWIHPYFLLGTDDWPYRVPGARPLCWVLGLVFLAQVHLAARRCDRVVWTVHNLCNQERRYPELDRWVGGRVADVADDLQAWDDRTRSEVAEYFDVPESRVTAVPHGNYCPLYGDPVDARTARDRLGLSEYDRVLLYFGLIRPYKRVPDLVETFSTVADDDACLLVAGNPKQDDLGAEIRRLAAGQPNVRLDLRFVPDEEVPTLFGAADFAVFPYDHVFSSGSVLLSMSLGTAVVAPPEGCLPSVLPPGNVLYDGLAGGIEEALATDDGTIGAVGDRNLAAAETEHDWETVARRTVQLYRGSRTVAES